MLISRKNVKYQEFSTVFKYERKALWTQMNIQNIFNIVRDTRLETPCDEAMQTPRWSVLTQIQTGKFAPERSIEYK